MLPNEAQYQNTDAAIKTVSSSTNSEELGSGLHQLEDSFSHGQKVGNPTTIYFKWAAHGRNQELTLLGMETQIDNYDPARNVIDSAMYDTVNKGINDFLKRNTDYIVGMFMYYKLHQAFKPDYHGASDYY